MDIERRCEYRPQPLPHNATERQQHAWWKQHEEVLLFDTDAGDGWTATARIQPGQDGKPAITEFRLWTDRPDTEGLTSTRIRDFRFGEFARALYRQFAEAPDPSNVVNVSGLDVLVDPDDWIDMVTDAGFTDLDRVASTRGGKRGREPLGNAELLRFAVPYAKAVADGVRKPVVEVARQFPGYEVEFIRTRLDKARKAGLLTRPPRKGVPGGQLTAKALELQRQLEERKTDDQGDTA